jgi:hypothetical protein
MMKRYKLLILIMFVAFLSNAQNWALKEIGVGLIVEDENYDKVLNIAQRGTNWDIKNLYDNGALAGKYKGNQLFAAWIQGPPQSEFRNSYGIPVWLYKYKITSPDGKTFEAGPFGFYEPGFAYFGIKTGGYTTGNWKVEFYIWHRDNNETRQVGTVEFKTFEGK